MFSFSLQCFETIECAYDWVVTEELENQIIFCFITSLFYIKSTNFSFSLMNKIFVLVPSSIEGVGGWGGGVVGGG